MKKNIESRLFIGRPFPAGLMNAQKSFMYWYGVLADVAKDEVPTGLMKFELPAAEVAEEVEENQTLVFFNLPLTSTVPNFAKKVVASGIEVHENLGDSDTPYITWDLDMDTKKLAQVMYLKASK